MRVTIYCHRRVKYPGRLRTACAELKNPRWSHHRTYITSCMKRAECNHHIEQVVAGRSGSGHRIGDLPESQRPDVHFARKSVMGTPGNHLQQNNPRPTIRMNPSTNRNSPI